MASTSTSSPAGRGRAPPADDRHPGCVVTPPSWPSGARAAHRLAQARRLRAGSAGSSSTASWRRTRPTCSPRPSCRSGSARAQAGRRLRAARPDPGLDAAGAARSALFELAYACGLRAEELVDLDVGSVDFDAEQVRVEGKGGKTRFVPVESMRCGRWGATWSGAPRTRAGRGSPRCSSRRPAGGSRRPTCGAGCGSGPGTPRRRARCPARAASLVRDPSAGGRRRSTRDPGALGHASISTTQVYTRVESARLRQRTSEVIPERNGGSHAGNQRQSDRAQGPLAPLQGAGSTAHASSSSSPTPRW